MTDINDLKKLFDKRALIVGSESNVRGRPGNPKAFTADMTNMTSPPRAKSWRSVVLKHLRRGSTISFAARAAGVSRQHVYFCMRRDDGFKHEVQNAFDQGTDRLEDRALLLATQGASVPRFYKGKQVFVGVDRKGQYCELNSPQLVKKVLFFERRPNTKLLIFLLQARRPKTFRPVTECPVCGENLYEQRSETDSTARVD